MNEPITLVRFKRSSLWAIGPALEYELGHRAFMALVKSGPEDTADVSL